MTTTIQKKAAPAIVVACALIVLLEGYDQSVYGAVLPVLVQDPSWGLSRADAGYVGSAALVGMMIGALVASRLTARFSRRNVLLWCLAICAVFGTACWAASDGWTLGLFRLLTGLGLGGVLPVTSTLTFASVSAKHRMLAYSMMFATIPLGGLLAAAIAKVVIPAYGPMIMFAVPLPLVVIASIATWMFIPNSPAVRPSEKAHENESGKTLMGSWRMVTLLFIAATMLGLLLWYGLTTWLPGIMSAAGYNLGSSLTFQIVLLSGSIIGSIVLAPIYDRVGGNYLVVVGIYLLGTIALIIAISSPPQLTLLVLVFIAGAVAQGGLIALNGVVDRAYPEGLRSAALGATLGFGRIGAIIAPSVLGHIVGTSAAGSFILFASAAATAGVLALVAARAAASRSRRFAEQVSVSGHHALGAATTVS